MAIVNPISGTGKGKKFGETIAAHKENIDIFFTAPDRTAFELAKEAVENNYERVIGVGGDGTFSEIANGLLGSNVSLGIIPAGTGNDFSKGLRIPQDSQGALEIALRGRLQSVDLGKIDGRAFVNVVSFGFDAQIVQHIPASRKNSFLPVKWLYLTAFLKELFRPPNYPNIRMHFSMGGEPRTLEQQTTILVVANGPQYGAMFKIAPGASFSDGFLDFCWIEKMSKMGMLFNFPKVLGGTHLKMPQVKMFRLSSLVVVQSDRDLACQIDGEIFDSKKEYCIGVVPKALNVVVPFNKPAF